MKDIWFCLIGIFVCNEYKLITSSGTIYTYNSLDHIVRLYFIQQTLAFIEKPAFWRIWRYDYKNWSSNIRCNEVKSPCII